MDLNRLAVEVERLTFSYPGSDPALNDITFQVNQGEAFAVIGANGSGKTTLLLHLNGLLKGVGRVNIFGEEITRRNIKSIRSRVGLLFQDPQDQLFMNRILDDVAFGPLAHGWSPQEAEKRSREALESLQVGKPSEEPVSRLSLGEKKRVALASVLVLQPEILLLDEPTAGLDPKGRRRLIELLGDFPHTRLVATHDLDMVWDLCDKAMILDRGRVAAVGEARAILKDRQLLESHSLEMPLSAEIGLKI